MPDFVASTSSLGKTHDDMYLAYPVSADGVHIKPGMLMYGEDGIPWKVQGITTGKYSVIVARDGEMKKLKPTWLRTYRRRTVNEIAKAMKSTARLNRQFCETPYDVQLIRLINNWADELMRGDYK